MDPVIFKIICDKCLNLKFLVLPPPPKEKKLQSNFCGVFFHGAVYLKMHFIFFPFTSKK